MNFILLFFILSFNAVSASNADYTTKEIYGELNAAEIARGNPLKNKQLNLSEKIDPSEITYKYMDEDNDNAEDRLEKLLANSHTNLFTRSYLYQFINQHKLLFDNCRGDIKKPICTSLIKGIPTPKSQCSGKVKQKVYYYKLDAAFKPEYQRTKQEKDMIKNLIASNY